MKIYLYDPETGFYLGEDFEREQLVRKEDGVTTIVPPPYRPGQTLFFDSAVQRWSVVEAKARQGIPGQQGWQQEIP